MTPDNLSNKNVDILLISATDIEDKIIRSKLQALNTNISAEQTATHKQPYQLCRNLGSNKSTVLAYAQATDMGSIGKGSSSSFAFQLISDLKPKLVVSVGICWGALDDKQKLGDVIVPSRIAIGNDSKIDEHGKLIDRGNTEHTEPRLLSILRNTHKSESNTFSLYSKGVMYSIPILFDNKDLRDKFIAAQPNAAVIGGEMEAAGLFTAITLAKSQTDWRELELLVLKGICDYGHNKNVADKDKDQEQAATNAISLFFDALSKYDLLPPWANTNATTSASSPAAGQSHVTVAQPTLAHKPTFTWHDTLTASPAPLSISHVTQSDFSKDPSLVYWPVRVRKPNIVHCAQSYVAAFLAAKGHDVRLCIDDLDPDQVKLDETVHLLQNKIRSWVARIANDDIANNLIEKSIRLSKRFGNKSASDEAEKIADPKAMEKLGENIVDWLLDQEKLRSVLKQTKLMINSTTADLDERPRKLLSAAVIWTMLDLIANEEPAKATHYFTLGGEDEQDIWKTCPSKDDLSITRILLPRVNGKMDDDALYPSDKHGLTSLMKTRGPLRDWLKNYLAEMPQRLANDLHGVNPAATPFQTLTPAGWAARIWDFYDGQ